MASEPEAPAFRTQISGGFGKEAVFICQLPVRFHCGDFEEYCAEDHGLHRASLHCSCCHGVNMQ